jgi:SAM-dependent methyltransferase
MQIPPDMVWPRTENVLQFLRLGAFRPEIPDWEQDIPGLTLNIGAGKKLIEDTAVLDLPKWDADEDPIPYNDESVSNIYMIHILEHVKYPIALLRECQRVLIPGGHLNIIVPYWRTELAHNDLDHKTFWTEDSLARVLGNPYYDKSNLSDWKMEIGLNIIAGIAERNLMLLTQLIKR